jgi:hypothetical protein
MSDLIDIVHAAFPPLTGQNPIPIEDVYEFYSRESLGRPIATWSEITEDDMKHGHFGALLHVLMDRTFVAWLPAWLVNVPVYGNEIPNALAAFSGCLSPRGAAAVGRSDLLLDRVKWLTIEQRRAVAAAGWSMQGKHIDFFRYDIGHVIGETWDRYAAEGSA